MSDALLYYLLLVGRRCDGAWRMEKGERVGSTSAQHNTNTIYLVANANLVFGEEGKGEGNVNLVHLCKRLKG